MTDVMVAGSIGAPVGPFNVFLNDGARDHAAGLDTVAARWAQARGEAVALPVKRSAEVMVALLDSPDPKIQVKAAAFIQERVGGLAPPAPVQVQVAQVAVASGSTVQVTAAALNEAFRRKLEAERESESVVLEVAG